MAQNGWYIEKIITDLQSGKVDEFVKKEGKYYNFIKGEATTFTNASDNNGEAAGNLDAQEFTVQGIGSLVSDAIVVGGTTPAIYGNVIINVQAASGVSANWTSTSIELYSITSLPSTASFTITPTSGYALAASTFNSLSFSSFQLSTNMVSSISFSDTGTPGTASNTVTATVTFDTSFDVDSSTTYTDTFNLEEPGGVASTIWSGSFVVNGIFNDVNGVQDAFNNNTVYNSGSTISQVNNNQIIINGDKNVPNGVSSEIFDALIELGPNNYFQNAADVVLNVPSNEVNQYSVITNGIGQTTRQIRIFYTADGTQSTDDSNDIIISIGTSTANLNFIPSSVSLPPTSGTFDIAVNSDYSNWIVTESASWITSLFFVNQNTARIAFDVNVSGSDRSHTINLFSPSNSTSTPNDTLLIQQPLLSTPAITVFGTPNQYNYASGTFQSTTPPTNALGFTSFNGSGVSLDGLHIDSTGGIVDVTAESAFGNFTASYNSYNVIADPGVVSNTTVFGFVGGGNLFSIRLEISANTSTSTRSVDVQFVHPTDPTVSSTLTINQEAYYDSSVNTLQIFKPNSTSSSTGVYTDIGAVLEVDQSAGSSEVYVKIPNSDLTSDNYWEFSNNIYQLPISAIENFNNSANIIDSNPSLTPSVTQINYSLNPWVSKSSQYFAPNVGNNVNVLFDLNYTENNEFIELDNGEYWPTSREVVIKMSNPENTQPITTFYDDSFTLKQKSIEKCSWKQNYSSLTTTPGVFEVYGYENKDIPVLSTTSAPTVGCYSVEDSSGSFVIGNASWITTGSVTASSVNAGSEYIANFVFESNFTGSNRSAKLVAYHSTTDSSDHFTSNGDASLLGDLADELIVTQFPTTPHLQTNGASYNTNPSFWSTFIDASTITSDTTFVDYTHIVNSSSASNTYNGFEYYNNGLSNAVLDGTGFVVSSDFTVNYSSIGSSVPSWFNGGNHLALAPNSALQALPFDYEASSTDTRIARLLYKHSSAEVYIRIQIIINPFTTI